MWLIQILTTFDVLATTLYPITDGDDGSGQVVSVSFFFLLPQINEIVLSISFVSKHEKMKKRKILIIKEKIRYGTVFFLFFNFRKIMRVG